MRITNKLQTSFHNEFMYAYWAVVHANIKMPVLLLDIYFFPEKILKTTIDASIDFDFCNLSSSGDVVYKERW